VFDVFHIGHLRHLKKAKTFGDYLIVSITPDKYVNKGPNRPIFNEKYRAEVINNLWFVDEVIINDKPTAIELIKRIKPDVYVKGKDYKKLNEDITGNILLEKNAVESYGGKIVFTEEITFSSSNLVNNITLSKEAKNYIKIFKNIYTYKDVINYLDKLKDLNILVMGDSIKDEYMFGSTLGKSGKSPIVAFENKHLEEYDGGVQAIVNHLNTFVKNVDCETVFQTIVKRRYIQDAQKLFETYDTAINEYYKPLSRDISKYDLIIAADFGHGFFNKKTREKLLSVNFLALNTQSNAGNMGLNTINKYNRNADYICIDEKELRLAFSNSEDTIEDILTHNFKDIVVTITKGEYGCIIYKDGRCYSIPALTTNGVLDTIGAGDAFLSITSLLVYQNAPAEIVGFIGNCVGAIATTYMGNESCITYNKLCKYIEMIMK